MENKNRILVVDDEPDLLGVLVQRLQANGYAVGVASNGQEALASLKETLPDLIILDVLMPVMDGFTFYKELKKNKATSAIPVLVLTARNKMEDTFSAVGVDAFVAKPYDAQTLLAKVEELLAKTKDKQLQGDFVEPQLASRARGPHLGLILIGAFLAIVVLAVLFLAKSLATSSQEGNLSIKRAHQQPLEDVGP